MRLVLTRAAQRRLRKVSPKMRAALIERLEAMAEQPFAVHRNVERITGEGDAFRLRQDDWPANPAWIGRRVRWHAGRGGEREVAG